MPPRPLSHDGALWALPGLDSTSTTLELNTPFLGGDLLLALPSGAEPMAVEAICGLDSLVFPAEAGRMYYLHAGGGVLAAPGELQKLLATFHPERETPRRTMGAAEPDPHAVAPEAPTPWERWKGAWPYVIGALTLVLALAAARLLKPHEAP